MGIEKVLDSSADVGRKTISYFVNDPVGGASLAAGYGLLGVAPMISLPLLAFGAWHVPYTFQMRKDLHKDVKEQGLNEKTLDRYNRASWCSHRMAIAYAFSQGKYKEFKESLHKYSLKHYSKRLAYYLGKEFNKVKDKLRNIVF